MDVDGNRRQVFSLAGEENGKFTGGREEYILSFPIPPPEPMCRFAAQCLLGLVCLLCMCAHTCGMFIIYSSNSKCSDKTFI